MKRNPKIVALILVVIVAFSAYFYVRHTWREEAEAVVEEFLFAIQEGNTPQAALLLDLPEGEETTLLEAFDTELINAGKLQEIRLSYLRKATATISINIMGELLETELTLNRPEKHWKISAFPQIHVMQTTLLADVVEAAEGVYEYHFYHPQETLRYTCRILFEPEAGAVIDGVVVKDNLVYLQELNAKPLEKILAVGSGSLEDIREGVLPLSPDLIIYDQRQEEGPRLASLKDLIPGMEELHAATRGGAVSALVLKAPYVPERIRVLLNTSGYQGTRHREVQITSKKSFTLEDKLAEESLSLASGKVLTLKPGEGGGGILALLPDGTETPLSTRVHISGAGPLEIASLQRGPAGNPVTPAYRGTLEVALHEGSLLIVNELPLEEYLYSVVPSEMPLLFGLEPLKAQAVAARSYAATSIYNSGYKSLGAHVDDSVNSQVYNNVPEVPLAITAVQETTGLVAFFGSSIIDARYFSTSSGNTANFHEVWHDPETKAFPSTPIRYLVSHSQLAGIEFDISNEDRIRDFLDRSDLDGYDSVSPFFRWEVTMTRAELEATIEENLAERYEAQPDFVLSKQGSNFVSREIPEEPLGQLENIRVAERGEGGNVMALEITGEQGSYLIRKEYNIRFLLRPRQYLPEGEDILIYRHTGSVLRNYALLPSAFIYFQINRNGTGDIETVTIRGGGNGHGVGMSQYGAYGMSQRGHDFRDILRHYYPKTELWSIYAW